LTNNKNPKQTISQPLPDKARWPKLAAVHCAFGAWTAASFDCSVTIQGLIKPKPKISLEFY
jgi:hypothetical protein